VVGLPGVSVSWAFSTEVADACVGSYLAGLCFVVAFVVGATLVALRLLFGLAFGAA
jgi:hypothetical protein